MYYEIQFHFLFSTIHFWFKGISQLQWFCEMKNKLKMTTFLEWIKILTRELSTGDMHAIIQKQVWIFMWLWYLLQMAGCGPQRKI